MAIRRICRKLLIFRPHNLCKQGVAGSIPATSTNFFLIANLCTTRVQECGFEGPEIGPKQRRINNRLLGYRPQHRGEPLTTISLYGSAKEMDESDTPMPPFK